MVPLPKSGDNLASWWCIGGVLIGLDIGLMWVSEGVRVLVNGVCGGDGMLVGGFSDGSGTLGRSFDVCDGISMGLDCSVIH